MTNVLQQCLLFFIVVVILGHDLGNSQVSVYRTIGPTLVFYSNRIRTLVAMATYSSHRLIMGKEEIDNFFLSHWGYLDFFFTEMFIE